MPSVSPSNQFFKSVLYTKDPSHPSQYITQIGTAALIFTARGHQKYRPTTETADCAALAVSEVRSLLANFLIWAPSPSLCCAFCASPPSLTISDAQPVPLNPPSLTSTPHKPSASVLFFEIIFVHDLYGF